MSRAAKGASPPPHEGHRGFYIPLTEPGVITDEISRYVLRSHP